MPGGFESGMGLIGALAGFAGKKPTVPEAPHVDATKAASDAITGNISNLPAAEDFVTKLDEFNIDELFKNLERFSPGITKAIGKIPGIISDQLSGKVPDDVLQQIQRGLGAKAWQSGLSASQRASIGATTIGQTSYSIQQQGVASAERWMAQIEGSIPKVDFSSMFITPAQSIAAEQWNEANRFNTQWMGNKIAAMPSPKDQAWMSALQGLGSQMDTVGNMALGNFMGGGNGLGGNRGGGGGSDQLIDYSMYDTAPEEFYMQPNAWMV